MDRDAKQREIQDLYSRIQQIEGELSDLPAYYQPGDFYAVYHALAGSVLGMFGAGASLVFNIVGAVCDGRHPLDLIRYYLTFPLGDKAFDPGLRHEGLILAIGCCLYLATGMVLGMVFHLIMMRWFADAGFLKRFAAMTVLSLLAWIVNFYGILSWLQPLLIGGDWIVEGIPWWVAAATHLVFGWTMLLMQPLGAFLARTNKETS